MPQNFEFGQLYLIKDEAIVYPDNPKRNPGLTKVRPVVILDDNEEQDGSTNPIITIAPISTKFQYKRTFDIDCIKGSCVLKENSLIRVGCLQGVLKSDLTKFLGEVDEETKTKVYAALILKFGIAFNE